jgi:putative transposase
VIKLVYYNKGSHTVHKIEYHLVWVTKYRYEILNKNMKLRLIELIKQGCDARNIKIIKGHVGSDHIHILVSCPPTIAVSEIVKYLKGRSSKFMQEEFSELKTRYWGRHLWATVGAVTEEMIKEYIENQDKEDMKDIFTIED